MDGTTSEATPSVQYLNIVVDQQQLSLATVSTLQQSSSESPSPSSASTSLLASASSFERPSQRHCFGDSTPGEFPLAAKPSIVLHVLTHCNLDPKDLVGLEATCTFFRRPANFDPDNELSITELAALDMCMKRAIFKPMTSEERNYLKKLCGGSWKLVLRFLLAGEACSRREKSQAVAGPCHSIAVSSSGLVYSFGSNTYGQLGHGTLQDQWKPIPIRSLQGIRIMNVAAGAGKTMFVSDTGRVYGCGKETFGEGEYEAQGNKLVTIPQLVESLKNTFVVQTAIGNFFTAVLSREGNVYTFSWGDDARLCHQTDPNNQEPHLLTGGLENVPVVQIAAGYCYLLALACQPDGMSVYSVGCGLGGKLGHGTRTDEKYPKLIEQFKALNLQPMVVAAGAWHAAVVGKDGRVCTWGWGRYGCLGHGNEDYELLPKVVEGLSKVKAVHVATGDYTTFIVSEDGDVYSFGCGESSSLGHAAVVDGEVLNYIIPICTRLQLISVCFSLFQGNRHTNVLVPQVVASLKQVQERVVQISLTNSIYWNAHTFALMESGKLYAFGSGDKGQLGVELASDQTERGDPEKVGIDLC